MSDNTAVFKTIGLLSEVGSGFEPSILTRIKKQKHPFEVLLYCAEREGFEPTVGSSPTAVFKTAAINRSAISPGANIEEWAKFHKLISIN